MTLKKESPTKKETTVKVTAPAEFAQSVDNVTVEVIDKVVESGKSKDEKIAALYEKLLASEKDRAELRSELKRFEESTVVIERNMGTFGPSVTIKNVSESELKELATEALVNEIAELKLDMRELTKNENNKITQLKIDKANLKNDLSESRNEVSELKRELSLKDDEISKEVKRQTKDMVTRHSQEMEDLRRITSRKVEKAQNEVSDMIAKVGDDYKDTEAEFKLKKDELLRKVNLLMSKKRDEHTELYSKVREYLSLSNNIFSRSKNRELIAEVKEEILRTSNNISKYSVEAELR